jgi:hypothetical protein
MNDSLKSLLEFCQLSLIKEMFMKAKVQPRNLTDVFLEFSRRPEALWFLGGVVLGASIPLIRSWMGERNTDVREYIHEAIIERLPLEDDIFESTDSAI